MTWTRALRRGRGRSPRFRRCRRAPGRDHRPRHDVGRRAVGALRALPAGRRRWAMPREICANWRLRSRGTSPSKPTARPAPAVPAETRPPSAGRASIEVVVLYACAAPIRNLSIRDGIDAFLGIDHHTIADIQWPGGSRQVIFEKGQRQASIAMTGDAAPERRSGGPVCFLSRPRCRAHPAVASTICCSWWRSGSGRRVSGSRCRSSPPSPWRTASPCAVGAGHSSPSPRQIVEPVIALSIAYVAFENLTMKSVVSRRWAVSFLFGLVHGFRLRGRARRGRSALERARRGPRRLQPRRRGRAGAYRGRYCCHRSCWIGDVLLPWEPRLTRLSRSPLWPSGLGC